MLLVGAGGPTAPGGFPVYESVHSYERHTFCAHVIRNSVTWSRRAAVTYSRTNSIAVKISTAFRGIVPLQNTPMCNYYTAICKTIHKEER